MIQRIQSLFLAIISIIMTLFLFLPIWKKIDPASGMEVAVNALGMLHTKGETVILEKGAYHIFILAFLSVIVSIISLFNFRNRPRQMLLGLINSLLISAAIISSVLLINSSEEVLLPNERGSFQVGLFLPIIALLCNMLANRFIRRDEQLVRSADRIR